MNSEVIDGSGLIGRTEPIVRQEERIYICNACIAEAEIDETLELTARSYEYKAALTRALIGRLVVSDPDEWPWQIEEAKLDEYLMKVRDMSREQIEALTPEARWDLRQEKENYDARVARTERELAAEKAAEDAALL